MSTSYAVFAEDSGKVIWTGVAASPIGCCAEAVRDAGISLSVFLPYDFAPPSHKEDGVERLVLLVYAFPELEKPPSHSVVERLAGEELDARAAGAFMARIL